MFRRFGTLLAALALFTVAGGHWAVLQSVAWGQMLRDYSRDASLTTAVAKTFSGEYPCAMCRQIAEAKKQEEQKPALLKADQKVEPFLTAGAEIVPPPARRDFSYRFSRDRAFASRSDAPPAPVPIAVS